MISMQTSGVVSLRCSAAVVLQDDVGGEHDQKNEVVVRTSRINSLGKGLERCLPRYEVYYYTNEIKADEYIIGLNGNGRLMAVS